MHLVTRLTKVCSHAIFPYVLQNVNVINIACIEEAKYFELALTYNFFLLFNLAYRYRAWDKNAALNNVS